MAGKSKASPASESPTLKEIHWLAGYLDGEGSFIFPNRTNRSATVSVCATDKEPLEKCYKFFGGRLRGPYGPYQAKRKPFYEWTAIGSRAIGIALTIFPLMSPRRQEQIKRMVKEFKG